MALVFPLSTVHYVGAEAELELSGVACRWAKLDMGWFSQVTIASR